MSQLDVTELDFATIKQSLKVFMSSQSEFSDYDFDGSALSVLLDVLSYNTHYNGMLAHMQANESFLDSAIKRSSVVSIARSLGYTPRSKRSATAYVDFTLVPDPTYINSTFSLSRDTIFTASVDNTTYNFYPSATTTQTLQTINGVTGFVFSELALKEGTRVSNNYIIDASNLSGPITIPNVNIDTSTLRVRVQKSATDEKVETYLLSKSLLDISSTTKAYFLEESIDGLSTIRFGDNIISKQLEAGNIVIVDYITTGGAIANGAKGFSCSATLTGASETKTFDTTKTIPAASGQEKESIDSIRRNAPAFNATKERAVSAQDYQSLILSSNTNIQSVSVWGGENNDPPIYGKVYISLDPIAGQIITQSDKDKIVSTVIGPKSPVAILPEFVDPIYTYIGLKVGVVYDTKTTVLTSGQLSDAVSNAINNFFDTELNTLNKNFYYSKIHDAIKSVSASIVSVNVTPTLQKRLLASLNLSENYTFTYNSRIQPRELHSTWFNAIISSATVKVKIQDVPNADVVAPIYNGSGVLNLVDVDGSVVANIGTIDYNTGKLNIPSMTVASLFDNQTHIKIRTRPHDDSKDISTNVLTRTSAVSTGAVFATPATNTILTLDNSAASLSTGSRKGLEINITSLDQAY